MSTPIGLRQALDAERSKADLIVFLIVINVLILFRKDTLPLLTLILPLVVIIMGYPRRRRTPLRYWRSIRLSIGWSTLGMIAFIATQTEADSIVTTVTTTLLALTGAMVLSTCVENEKRNASLDLRSRN
jgi:hypothetical protein